MITKKEKVDWNSTDRRKPDVIASLVQMFLLTLLTFTPQIIPQPL